MADRAYGQTHQILDRRVVGMYTSLIEKLAHTGVKMVPEPSSRGKLDR
jgi:hypothetical protein